MNELGAIQRAELFADVETLKETVTKINEGCLLLAKFDNKVTGKLTHFEDDIAYLKKMDRLNSRRLDTAYDHRNTLSIGIDRIDRTLNEITNRLDKIEAQLYEKLG